MYVRNVNICQLSWWERYPLATGRIVVIWGLLRSKLCKLKPVKATFSEVNYCSPLSFSSLSDTRFIWHLQRIISLNQKIFFFVFNVIPMYEQKHKHKSGYAIVQVKKLRKWKENRWVMPFKSQSLFIHQQKHGKDYLTATVDPQKVFKYPRVLWIFGSENVIIIPIMHLDWRWSQLNLIVVELLHRLFNLFTSSSVEHPSASENRLKHWSLSGIVRHTPASKLQNDV